MSNHQHLSIIVDKLFSYKADNYIFIYTPPKVGSTTLVSSLRLSLGVGFSVIHIHDETMLQVLTGITNVSINDIIRYLANIGKTVYVIDVYRTPIERKMSEFFEKISPYHFNNSEENINKYSIKRVTERFNNVFPHLEDGDHYVDKYNIPGPTQFDFNKKYLVQRVNNVTYVKLRLCDSSMWGVFLSTILGSEIAIVSDYQSSQKTIGDLYARFKNEYLIPSNFLETIRNCKQMRLYYSEEERKQYLDMWATKTCEPITPYTPEEYKFYINLCLENQYINDIHVEHYIDNGCVCKLCSSKRSAMFLKAKRGEKIDRIVHIDVVNERTQNINNKINEINEINRTIYAKNKMAQAKNKTICAKNNSKFVAKQFNINLYQ
jgi:hypothetical protein